MAGIIERPCQRCGAKAATYYDIPAISETHLCADCVLDLMASDPSADIVMRYVHKTGQDKPFYSQNRPDRYPFDN